MVEQRTVRQNIKFAEPDGVLDPGHTILIPPCGFQRPLGLCFQGPWSFGEDLASGIRTLGISQSDSEPQIPLFAPYFFTFQNLCWPSFFTSIFHRFFSIWEGFWNGFWRPKLRKNIYF